MTEETPKAPLNQKALQIRKKVSSKRPRFRQQESWRYKRIEKRGWKKPFGIDNKMRIRTKGWPKIVEIGYRGPRVARGLHPSGYTEVLVRTVDDIERIDAATQAIRIYHAVGTKKRIEILEKARQKKIHVLNSREVKETKEKEEPKEKKEEKQK